MIVKRVRSGRGTILIEWTRDDMIHRGWIPDDMINADNEVTERTIQSSIPFGLPFEHIIDRQTISPQILADSLRRRGIWTEEDVMKNPETVQKAIIASAELSVSRIQSRIRSFHLSEEIAVKETAVEEES